MLFSAVLRRCTGVLFHPVSYLVTSSSIRFVFFPDLYHKRWIFHRNAMLQPRCIFSSGRRVCHGSMIPLDFKCLPRLRMEGLRLRFDSTSLKVANKSNSAAVCLPARLTAGVTGHLGTAIEGTGPIPLLERQT